jgi:outer membrane protein OmpA-like peptidoglycan-associated protein
MKLNRLLLQGALLAAGLCTAATTPAQTTQLTSPKDRVSDQAIQADQRAYETMQSRIKGLNDRGRPVRDYHLSKAQCWLDVSFHEYTRNDRGPFPQAALTESEKLVVGMEAGRSPLPMDTPLVGEAVTLRPDLWSRADALKRHRGFRCAQQKVACAEVELVHAGNEHAQQQWRHAKPYVQIAEDLLGEADALAERCEPPAPPVVLAPPPPPPPPAPPAPPAPVPVQEIALAAHVVFNFDKHQPKDIRPFSIVQLEELVARVKRDNLVVQSIKLAGHADRLNSTGQNDYNQRLSERRVQTVREMLAKLGMDDKLVSTGARGDSEQVTACAARFKRQDELQECLLPNRRVEVLISARRR